MAVLYVASAAFTPAFQSMIPDLLEDEGEYTKALSLSRLAADLESVASPMLAAVLLAVISYNNLFVATAIGFVISLLRGLPGAERYLRAGDWQDPAVRLPAALGVTGAAPTIRSIALLAARWCDTGQMPHSRCTMTGTSHSKRPRMKRSKPRNSTICSRASTT